MNKTIIIVLISLLLISGCQKKETVHFGISMGQSPYDIAVNYYEEGDYENAIATYEKILADTKRGIAEGGLNEYWIKCMMARSYLEIKEYDPAGIYIEEAVKGYIDYEETGHGYDFVCQTEGIYYKEIGKYEKAVQSLEKAIKYADPEDEWYVTSYIELGLCYENIGNEQKQIECYQRALELSEQRDDYADMADVYSVWGIYYAQRGNMDKGEELFKKSLEYARKAWGEESYGVANIYQKLSANYSLKKEYEEAINYSEKALNIYLNLESGSFQREIASLYSNLGYFNLEMGDKETALYMMKKSYEIVKEKENKNILDFYENVLSVNIKQLYSETEEDGTDYDEWFNRNFGSYEGIKEYE